MKWLFALFCCCIFSRGLPAQDVTVLIKEGNELEAAMKEKAAFDKFLEVVRIQPANSYALNKCSELCSRIGNRETTALSKKDYYSAAQKFAAIALKLNPDDAAANCSMAIALGRVSLEKSGKEKINAAKEIKMYADKSLKNDPGNFKAWHVLGRWHYEVSNLNFFEKAAIKVLFGGMPKASFEEAVKCFEKAKSLTHGFVINDLELAKAYRKTGQQSKAEECLSAMLLQPDKTEDDAAAKQKAEKLLNEWK